MNLGSLLLVGVLRLGSFNEPDLFLSLRVAAVQPMIDACMYIHTPENNAEVLPFVFLFFHFPNAYVTRWEVT
jgi:hypothetical protein